MIEGGREYEITREQVRIFEAALDDAERTQTTADPLIQKVIIESIASQLETFQRELYEYEHGITHQKEPVGVPEVLLGAHELAREDVVTARIAGLEREVRQLQQNVATLQRAVHAVPVGDESKIINIQSYLDGRIFQDVPRDPSYTSAAEG